MAREAALRIYRPGTLLTTISAALRSVPFASKLGMTSASSSLPSKKMEGPDADCSLDLEHRVNTLWRARRAATLQFCPRASHHLLRKHRASFAPGRPTDRGEKREKKKKKKGRNFWGINQSIMDKMNSGGGGGAISFRKGLSGGCGARFARGCVSCGCPRGENRRGALHDESRFRLAPLLAPGGANSFLDAFPQI